MSNNLAIPELEAVKKPNVKSGYTEDRVAELSKCVDDPLYFMENYMKIQHPTKGSLPLKLYPYQEEMVRAFHEHRFSVTLSARQLGKCLQSHSTIQKEGRSIYIKSLILQGFRDKVVLLLEKMLIWLARRYQ